MDKQLTAEEIYRQQLNIHSANLKDAKRKRSNLGWLRLAIVLGIILAIYSLFISNTLLVWLSVFAGIAVFLYVVSIDADNNNKISFLEKLVAINAGELTVIKGDYYNREDGLNFLPKEHPYAADIDLFGIASLYQYINRCTSEQSKQLLAALLLNPSTKEAIIERQEAAKALAAQYEWRQRLQASGMEQPLTLATEQKMSTWLEMANPLPGAIWRVLPNVFTIITLTTVAAYLLEFFSGSVFWLLIFVYFLFAKYTSGKVIMTYTALSRIENEINTIYEQIRQVEKLPASSLLLDSYKKILQQKGSGCIKELKQILHRFEFRLNLMVYFVLNTLFLWDVRQTNSLNEWKTKNQDSVAGWFSILSNIEVISTIATLTFNHPSWSFPVISDVHFTLSGEEVGHPLIAEDKRVDNSYATNGTGKVSVITGSNMAGKSTFLRSIGVNIVLASMGAPVCARSFTCSLVYLYSSMRIADNLAENTSTFYAELKKLKTIIDQVRDRRKVFILLDEILRGTNSMDRHTGSEALIKQLIREDAVAIIATHDVELAALEKDFKRAISNYHFDVQVAGEELYFDYKLKRGVCQSMNASLLMKKIGIEM
jgi:hypothetical protein